MHSEQIQKTPLTANEISYIVNLICPHCGGPLGGTSRAFKCQGICRKDWRPEWETAQCRTLKRPRGAKQPVSDRSRHVSPGRHPWRGTAQARSQLVRLRT